MNEPSAERIIADGNRILAFLSDPAIASAILNLEQKFIDEFKASKSSEDRVRAWARMVFLDEFKDGEVHITINLEELRAASDKGLAAANRVAIALIASAVILGSALIGTLVQTGPHIFGLAWIGVPGFVAGLVLFVWIVWGMIRSGSW